MTTTSPSHHMHTHGSSLGPHSFHHIHASCALWSLCLIALCSTTSFSSPCSPSCFLSLCPSFFASTSSARMWWTNSLCTSANEDLGTLAEYDPLTQLAWTFWTWGCRAHARRRRPGSDQKGRQDVQRCTAASCARAPFETTVGTVVYCGRTRDGNHIKVTQAKWTMILGSALTSAEIIGYRSVLGQLLWLGQQSRPDLCLGVSLAAQKLSKATRSDVKSFRCLLRRRCFGKCRRWEVSVWFGCWSHSSSWAGEIWTF